MDGQMSLAQRRLVYDTVVRLRPTVVVECGTWFGGGSTLQIAEAMKVNSWGMLLTWELDAGRFQRTVESYMKERPDLLPFILFRHGDFLSDLRAMPKLDIDVAMLDGPEDANYTSLSFLWLQDRVKGAIIFHDWDVGKCDAVRAMARPTTYLPGDNGIAVWEPAKDEGR